MKAVLTRLSWWLRIMSVFSRTSFGTYPKVIPFAARKLMSSMGMTFDRPSTLRVSGKTISLYPERGDVSTIWEIFVEDVYPDVIEDRGITTIVDVGASIGLYSLMSSQRFPGLKTILCVEPQASSLVCLEQNIAANGLGAIATVIRKGLFSRSGHMGLSTEQRSSAAQLVEQASSSADYAVPVITLDELLATSGVQDVDILKIDVEGAEMEVLRGGKDVLRRTKHVVLEYHSQELFDSCGELLGSIGFDSVYHNPEHRVMYWSRVADPDLHPPPNARVQRMDDKI